jgi:hypothetical protein
VPPFQKIPPMIACANWATAENDINPIDTKA